MTLIETKGDICFYEDKRGKLLQRIGGSGEIFKVKNGKLSFKPIEQVNGYDIRYNTNGVYGFVVCQKNIPLEDGFWRLDDARNCARTM